MDHEKSLKTLIVQLSEDFQGLRFNCDGSVTSIVDGRSCLLNVGEGYVTMESLGTDYPL